MVLQDVQDFAEKVILWKKKRNMNEYSHTQIQGVQRIIWFEAYYYYIYLSIWV